MKRLMFIVATVLLTWPAMALDPAEMLADPVLEARARALDFEIRCVKCQSEAVASSNADWAKDARRITRELIAEGASDQDVLDWFHERYGDFVLMDPPKTGANLILWLAGPALLLLGASIAWVGLRRRQNSGALPSLSQEEQARLNELLEK